MSEFKIGDRVRISKPFIEDEMVVHIVDGDCGTVTFVNELYIGVTFDEPYEAVVAKDEVELVEPTDCKAAFLAELKELLVKYDASIYPNGCVVDGIGFKVGNEDIYYNMNYGFGDFITAGNINDYDKEGV